MTSNPVSYSTIISNKIYPLIPDFEKWEKQIHADKWLSIGKVATFGIAATGYVLYNNDATSRRIMCWVTLGVLGSRLALNITKSFREKVWNRTDAGIIENETRELWGRLLPPTNKKITQAYKEFVKFIREIENSFPTPSDIMRPLSCPNYPAPDPKKYTYEEIEKFSKKAMEHALLIAEEVYQDLQKLSREGFTPPGGKEPIYDPKILLTMQPGWSQEPNSGPWLYRGYFCLPLVYRNIFNLDQSIKKIKKNIENTTKGYQEGECGNHGLKEMKEFYENYPNKNLFEGKDWSKKFFTSGTWQNEFREEYNKKMQQIFDLMGGFEQFEKECKDTRFASWGQLHNPNESFPKSPDSMPT